MATVFLAQDPLIGRDVAVKVLPREFLHDPSFRGRFEREARTIAMLEHPAIVPIYDFGEQDGQPFLVMRYMKGGSLADRLHEGPLTVEAAASILKRIGAALDHAHSHGVIHRDLKPGNILFDEYDLAFLSDFGIVKLAQETVTFTGDSIVGTPAYMSPEQVHGRKAIDGRSDLYTLGLILFEMLTGEMPFRADTPAKIMMAHVMNPVPPISGVRPDLPAACERIVSRALAKEPEERFQTGADLAEALRETVEGKRSPSGRRQEEAPSRRETALERPVREGPTVPPAAQRGAPDQAQQEVHGDAAAGTEAAPDLSGRRNYLWPALGVALALALCCGGIAALSAFFPEVGGFLGFASGTASPPPAVTTPADTEQVDAQLVDAPATSTAEALAALTATAGAEAESEGATATRVARLTATADAQAAAIATRIVESTVTAEARLAATATAYGPTRAVEEAIQDVLRIQRNDPVFGPSSGNLVHIIDGFIKSDYADLDVRDFLADAVFLNPYAASTGGWDIGFLFRETEINNQFRLTVESDGEWSLTAQEGDAADVVNSGVVNNLNTGDGAANRLTLLANDEIGYLFINGRYVDALDLSAWNVSGNVGVGTSFYEGNEIDGEATAYEEFTVWSPQGE